MRIAIINNLYPPYSRGGTEQVVASTVKELIKDHQVFVITTMPDGDKESELEGNLRICRFNPKNFYYILDDDRQSIFKKILYHLYNFFNFEIARQINIELDNFAPDIVITHNLNGFSYQIFRMIRRNRLSWLHVLHDYQLIDPHGSLHRNGINLSKISFILWIYSRITRLLIKQPDTVISPSKFVLDKHLSYGYFKYSRILVLHNPVDLPEPNGKNLSSDIINFVYVGQVEPHKGVEFLIKTFLRLNNINARLKVVGNGSKLEKLKKLSLKDSRIIFAGKIDHDKVKEIYRESDVLILPSVWWENSPTVIYEAYANGLPVLVSDSGGSGELVKEGKTGWIFKSGDKNDLLSKLKHLCVIKNDLSEFGLNGREFISNFTPQKYVERLMSVISCSKR